MAKLHTCLQQCISMFTHLEVNQSFLPQHSVHLAPLTVPLVTHPNVLWLVADVS